MKGKHSTTKSVLAALLSLLLVVSVLTPMASFAETTGNYYTVRSGDTLSRVAAAYGVTVAELVKLNNISNAAIIYPGQVLLLPDGAGATSNKETISDNSYNRVSLSFKDADLFSVLSAIARYTNFTLLFVGNTTTVTITLEDVSPLTAIDYVLRSVDMSYIRNGNTLMIGTVEVLNAKFMDRITLAKFSVRYITIEDLVSQLGTLGVSITTIKASGANTGSFFVNAYPMQMATIRELIELLDTKANVKLGSEGIAGCLSYLDMKYMNASTFSAFLGQLGLHAGIVLESFPMRLFIYTSGQSLTNIKKIKALVDIPAAASSKEEDSTTPTNGGQDTTNATGSTDSTDTTDTTDTTGGNGGTPVAVSVLQKLTLANISRADVANVLTTFGLSDKVTVLGVERLTGRTIWLYGPKDKVESALVMVTSFDVESANEKNCFFNYELENITAVEFITRIERFTTIGEAKFYTTSDSEISHTVTVNCPADLKQTVIDIIEQVDTNTPKIYKVIGSASSQTGVDDFKMKIALLSQLTGISADCFFFSSDLDTTEEGARFVVYVYESSETIALIQEQLEAIG